MVFKNETDLKNFLLKKCEIALIITQEKIYKIIDDCIREYYKDYDPVRYERTFQLFNSFVMTDIVPVGNGYEARVYFDIDGLRYLDGGQPSGLQVMKAAAQGDHGAIGKIPNPKWSPNFQYFQGRTGVDIWNTPSQKIDAEAINMLEQELIGQGIPVKRV